MPIKEDLSEIQTLNRRKYFVPADTILSWHPKNEMMIVLLSEKVLYNGQQNEVFTCISVKHIHEMGDTVRE